MNPQLLDLKWGDKKREPRRYRFACAPVCGHVVAKQTSYLEVFRAVQIPFHLCLLLPLKTRFDDGLQDVLHNVEGGIFGEETECFLGTLEFVNVLVEDKQAILHRVLAAKPTKREVIES